MRLTDTIERQYSLCSDPADRREWRVAVLREDVSRGGSRYVHDELRPGGLLPVRGPINNFELAPADRYVFVAGGIGITPILPMLAAARRRAVPWRLAYLGRSAPRMAFIASPLLAAPEAELFASEATGRVDLADWIGLVEAGTGVYGCGPRSMLDELQQLATRWPAGALHVERFQPAVPLQRSNAGSFTVECKRSALSLVVAPGESILQTIEDAGIDLPSSCREGVCGTCETRLIDGVAEHRDSILSADERAANDTMMICVSRARTPQLVLDV